LQTFKSALYIALTVFLMIRFPESAKAVGVLQAPEGQEVEGYRAQKYSRLKAKFEYLAFLSALITFACFYFDKFPNDTQKIPAWLFWIIVGVGLMIFVGFYILFCVVQSKNNISVYSEGYKTRFQKLGKFLNRQNRRAAMVLGFCYTMMLYGNITTLWFMLS
jgi:hypothetical protein